MSFYLADIASNLIRDTYHAAIVFPKCATDLTEFCAPIEEYGKSITLPIVDSLTAAADYDWSDDDPVSFQALSTTDKTANILTAAKGVALRDKEMVESKGGIKDIILADLGRVIAQKVDDACASEVLTNAVNTHTSSEFKMADIFEMLGDFGANVNADQFSGFIVSGKLYAKLVQMDGFVDACKTYNTGAINGVVSDQICGYIANIPVYLSDAKGMWNSEDEEANVVLLKKGALATVFQRMPVYEESRNLAKMETDILCNLFYAIKLVFPAQVSVLTVSMGE